MKKQRTSHKVFCWSTLQPASATNKKPRRIYYLSVRPVNNPKNSVDTRKYKSASGRNEMVLKISDTYNGKAVIVRNTNPNKK